MRLIETSKSCSGGAPRRWDSPPRQGPFEREVAYAVCAPSGSNLTVFHMMLRVPGRVPARFCRWQESLIRNHDSRLIYLMARNPSKHTYFMTLTISTKPALFNMSRLPWVEKGSRIPLRLRCLLRISVSSKPWPSLNSWYS